MAGIPGTNVAAMVVPFDDQDIFATHNDKYGRGGFRVVDLLADRNAITELRRKAGMWVRCLEDGKVYELGNDLLTWNEISFSGAPAGENDVTMEAGEDLAAGVPVKVVANLVYAATHTESNSVVGLTRESALTGFLATICTGGKLTTSGLTPGASYFLGVGVAQTTAPASGYVVRLGKAVTAQVMLVEIEEPILLS